MFHTGDGYNPYYKLWWALTLLRVAIPSKYGSDESARAFVQVLSHADECRFFFGTAEPPVISNLELHAMVPMKKKARAVFLQKCVRFWTNFTGPKPPLDGKVAVSRVDP